MGSFIRRSIFYAVLVFFVFSHFLSAGVLLSQPRNIRGTAVYPDHKSKFIYYYVPGELEIKQIDGSPEFFFHRYRYLGTGATGDSGVFKGRGIITFSVEFNKDTQRIREIEEVLKKEYKAVVLKPIPLESIQSELIYTEIEEKNTGKLEGGHWVKEPEDAAQSEIFQEGVWEAKRFTIGVNINTTNLLWETYHRGGVILSLNYSLIASGKSDLKAVHELEEVHKSVLNDSLTIMVSPSEYPKCFKSVDIGSEMPAGYTFLDVYCYDFQDQPRQQKLFRKVVEIKGTSITGSRPVEKAIFSSLYQDVYKRPIHFPFAVDLDKGYDYRVIRIDKEGLKKTGDWIHQDSWTGILDVTDYKKEKKKDRRKLY
ncbi:MAG: hypothetical protein KAX11_09780 [Candidatus Aminicenantes bacterium]|nr:hypothetical protein [Candidatus Aminicenantes bacterium]